MPNIANKKIYGLIWSLFGSLCFTTMMSLIKFLDPNVKGAVLVFIRYLFCLIFFLPFFLKAGVKKTIKTQRPYLHLLRVIFSCLGVTCTYYGYRNLPLAVAASLGFISPLMTTALAIVFLKEIVSSKKWILILVGYLGVLVVIQPPEFSFNSAVYILLLANFFASASVICSKKLIATESINCMIFYINVISTFFSGICAYFMWVTPSSQDFIILSFIGLIGITLQLCYVKSLQYANPSFLAPFEYIRLIIAMPLGFMLFQEIPTLRVFLGSSIIIVAIFLITRLESSNRII